MSNVTIVTALFNISRDRIDGRNWDEYLTWFDHTLKLNCNLVVFTSPDIKDFILKRRNNDKTKIFTNKIEELPYFYLKDPIEKIIISKEYQNSIKDLSRIECKESFYSIIQYSKFKWLELSILNNPFDSNFFFWIDAGASRFFGNNIISEPFPSNYIMNKLDLIGNKFIVQINSEFYKDLYKADDLKLSYLYDNRSFVLGSLFGGYKTAVSEVSKSIDYLLTKEMIENNNINNEQIALGYLVKKNPSLFHCYIRRNKSHMDLFNYLYKRSSFPF